MSGDRIEFDMVSAFTSGTVGVPGQRTFFLQARGDGMVISLKCEKQQVDALASYLRRLLEDLPTDDAVIHPSLLELEQPILASWALGQIGVAYDGENDRIVLLLEEIVDVDEEGEPISTEDHNSLRVRLTRSQAISFCEHTVAIVAGGRPPCRFCGEPVDSRGHACVRMN
jgi:uncharacterized repeat protein (TIGR03847 family)